MGLLGGGRNLVMLCYMCYFNVFVILDFEDFILFVVFIIIYEWWVRKFRFFYDVSFKFFLNFLIICCVNLLVIVFEL